MRYVPELVQPFGGGEGEVAAMVGIVGGINPIIAGTSGAVGSAEAFVAEKPESKGRAKFKSWLT
ncbi:hypothetical protein FVA74_04980 [Salinibacterium sp. dk2585]|uniref:hypothetical protein n=1 Tax=unclassified Salinibacterium TaxID=2632331 RepID=UPI0011C24EB0|nr:MULTISPECIES: hypothetical protein [unclassified Salinibacterium]QEE60998.1 hypothetical protein FVA74_04980 [Salinibacterium sp. dk2585]TXK52940.1 hypothetical protein FVP63_11100 [Salinibacterium sp. dk5596]